MQAARYCNVVPPTDFYKYDRIEQAVMMELYLEDRAIAAYQSEIDRINQERQTHNLGRRQRE